MKINNYNIITILGPTASGKTILAANLAYKINGEIISADSRQVYKHMIIGTGKDYEDYTVNNSKVPYHLIDIADPGYKYNVFEYQSDFLKVYNEIINRNKFPVLCGGTGMYIEAVLKGYKLIHVPINNPLREDLETKSMNELIKLFSTYKNPHNTTDTTSRKRLIRAIEIEEYYSSHAKKDISYPTFNNIFIGIDIERNTRRNKITNRLKARLKEGMIEEVENILKTGISPEDLIFYGLEYKFITQHILGKLSFDEMFNKLNTAIHQFAKRQMTWFRRMEKNGDNIHWVDYELTLNKKTDEVLKILKNN